MNMMKRALVLALVCVMMLTMLTACGKTAELLQAKQEALCAGKWLTITEDSQEQAQALAENIDLYPEEIALVDLTSLRYARVLEYSPDGTYRQYISVEHTKNCVREFYEGVFAALFANRSSLGALYDTDLSAMGEAEFRLFYADLYGFEEFDPLLTEFVENAYDYKWEDLESGTYTVKNLNTIAIERVSSDPEVEAAGTITFKVEGDTLTLDYSDGQIVYTNIG